MSLDAMVPRLEALVQEELGVQRQILENLTAQEAALLAADGDAVDALLVDARRLMAGATSRDTRRRMLLKDFERLWGVSAKSLTLGSIAARLEGSGRRLKRLRTELSDMLRETARTSTRVRTYARFQQGIIRDTVERVIESGGGRPSEGGTLVNAEA